jgi:hypothetical protein
LLVARRKFRGVRVVVGEGGVIHKRIHGPTAIFGRHSGGAP